MFLISWMNISNLRNILLNKENNIFNFIIFFILITFLLLRVPFIYNSINFFNYAYFVIFPLFMSLFFIRIEGGVVEFFASLIPAGTPLWIAPLVGVAETISYIVRPFVLIIRPFLNITIGSVGGAALGSLFFNSKFVLIFLCFLFFYEIFVAVVHWFIVVNILLFSKDH
uniref:ATPase subunit 6 n=1 Tax=Pseudorhabdosynochus yangjiangensis TaxID=1131907 RepID=A0A3G0WUW5_9PLAT|nr:ATPase subunit 6 [Pseudorhabdosynochus yangjiangensis]